MASEVVKYLLLLFAFSFSLLLSYFINKIIIKIEKKRDIHQQIHRLIVSTHKKKKDTPTLGGIAIFLSIILITSIFNFNFFQSKKGIFITILFTSYFFVGLVDDLKKLKDKNESGLPPLVRIGFEIAFALCGLLVLGYDQKTSWIINFPFDIGYINLNFLTPLFLIFIIVGSANASNLVDGLDGLSAGITTIALSPFIFFSFFKGDFILMTFLITVIGSLLGFVLLNLYPASIFMGDCGSLMLGAILGSIAICLYRIPELALIGGIYVIECASVIVQVSYYKAFKKRVFLMAPLHHHFELKGWGETKVVMFYYLIGVIFAVFGTIIGLRIWIFCYLDMVRQISS